MLSDAEKKKMRIYHRLLTGLQIGKNKASRMRFMTLTSTPHPPRPIKESFDILRLYIERADWYKDGFDGFKFNKYFCLRTKEGPNGVLHIIFWGGGYIPQKWLSEHWEKIHWAYKADIRACWTNRKTVNGLVGYLLPYLTDQQPIDRMSYGWKWAWLGFCKTWKKIKKVGQIRRCGSMKDSVKYVNISSERKQTTVRWWKFKTEKEPDLIALPNYRKTRNVSKEYWTYLTHKPLPTTRKVTFCNVNHSIFKRGWFGEV